MIIEMRTYNLKPGAIAEVEKRFAEALPAREKHSKLAAFWRTEIGPLNQVIQVWPYESFEQRLAIRAAAVKDGTWPPKLVDFVVDQTSEIYIPAPFSPKLEPRQIGPIFEMRLYTVQTGAMPGVIERWGKHIEERQKLSPLVGAWYSEVGPLNKWVHIWAYKDVNERFAVRDASRKSGNWPPPGAPPGTLVKQENKIVVPAAFSPIR